MSTAVGFLDRYIPGGSRVHRADPRAKLVVTLGFIVTVTSLPPGAWPMFAVLAALLWSAVYLSEAGMTRILRRTFLALPFVLVAVPSIFSRPGDPVFQIPVGPFDLTATDQGLVFFLSVLLKSWVSVTAAVLLTATTPFTHVMEALRALRVPLVLVAIISFMYRYIFVLVDEVQRLLRARSARSASVIGVRPGGAIRWRAKVAGGMAGSLFVRTYDRSERIYMAMVARGFDGRMRITAATERMTGGDIGWTLTALVLFSLLAIFAQAVW
jgi:cobalt/nickel transport system permease protein